MAEHGLLAQERLTIEEVAASQRRSVRALYEATRAHTIPFTRLPGSRRCLFDRQDLDAWEAGADLEVVDLPRGGVRVKPVESTRNVEPEAARPEPDQTADLTGHASG